MPTHWPPPSSRGGCPRSEPAPLTLYLGIDLGGTNVRSVVADASGERPAILSRDERATPRESADAIVAALAASARAGLARAERTLHDVVAVGCAAPGPLDARSGVVFDAPNLTGFRDFPLAERLSAALDRARTFVDRDTAMAAIAEGTIGAARGVRDFVYVTVSTGLGGAVVSDGRLLRGHSGTAGEIGHWPVARDGPRCGCGSRGCAEAFAAGRNLAERFGAVDAESVYAAAEGGDERARALVAEAEAALGDLAVGLVNVFNPALIVVGGAVAAGQPGHVLEPMRRAIAHRAFRTAASAVRITPAALGEDVGMLGAVLAARERAAGRGDRFL